MRCGMRRSVCGPGAVSPVEDAGLCAGARCRLSCLAAAVPEPALLCVRVGLGAAGIKGKKQTHAARPSVD